MTKMRKRSPPIVPTRSGTIGSFVFESSFVALRVILSDGKILDTVVMGGIGTWVYISAVAMGVDDDVVVILPL